MKQQTIMIVLGIVLMIISYPLAFFLSQAYPNSIMRLQIAAGVFLIGMIIFFLYLNRTHKETFLTLIRKEKKKAWGIVLYSAILGGFYEYLGQHVFELWYYPPLESYSFLLIVLFIGWVLFGIIIRESFIFLEGKTSLTLAIIMITAFHLIATESINLLTRSWIYDFPLIPFIIGWILLSITFYVLPKKLDLIA